MKVVLAFLICHVAALGFFALPSIFTDLSHERWPGELYNSIITSEFRIDSLFYFAIAPILSVITAAVFWDEKFRRVRWWVLTLCFVGLGLVAIIYFGFAVSLTQRDLWQLAEIEQINEFRKFSSLTTAFCIQNATVLFAILAFAMGTEFSREKISQLIAYFRRA